MTPEAPISVLNVIEESQSLLLALSVVAGTEQDAAETRERVQECLSRREPSETIEEHVVRAAMEVLTGSKPSEPVVGHPIPVEPHLAETLGLAWVGWARGDLAGALHLLVKCSPGIQSRKQESGMTRAALRHWSEALRHLLGGDTAEAYRLWNRAIEVSTIFGLDITPMVRWTCAASFYPAA